MNTKNTETDENIKTEYEGGVGALLTIEIEGKKRAILQKRTADDSFPGCLQVTVHGKLKKTGNMKAGTNRAERESMTTGLIREVKEEVREMIVRSTMEWSVVRAMEGIANITYDNTFLLREFGLRGLDPKGILQISKKKSSGNPSVRKTVVTLGFDITQKETDDCKDYLSLFPEIKHLVKDGVIVLLSAGELDKLVPLEPIHKENGVQEEGKYGMHGDEIEAVKKALGE